MIGDKNLASIIFRSRIIFGLSFSVIEQISFPQISSIGFVWDEVGPFTHNAKTSKIGEVFFGFKIC
jgi:hypothetical protein